MSRKTIMKIRDQFSNFSWLMSECIDTVLVKRLPKRVGSLSQRVPLFDRYSVPQVKIKKESREDTLDSVSDQAVRRIGSVQSRISTVSPLRVGEGRYRFQSIKPQYRYHSYQRTRRRREGPVSLRIRLPHRSCRDPMRTKRSHINVFTFFFLFFGNLDEGPPSFQQRLKDLRVSGVLVLMLCEKER